MLPPVLLDDAVARRQAEARPLADFLRGEEGLEDVRLHVRIHADAGVADGEQHVRPGLHGRVIARELGVEHDIARLDQQAPALRHRIARVDREVHEHLLELARIDPHAPQAAAAAP